MSLALHRLGLFISRHRLLVIVVWIVLLAGVLVGVRAVGAAYEDDYTIPGTESQEGQDVLANRFGGAASGASGQVLYRVPEGDDIADPGTRDAVAESLDAIAAVPGVASVTAPDQLDINDDADAALATIQFEDEQPDDEVKDEVARVAEVDHGSVTSTVGGSGFGSGLAEGGHAAEAFGLGIALVVLVLTFGSFLAAGMPIVTALVGVALTTGLLGLVSHLTPVAGMTPSFASMLGLAVGIDYALFIVSRHRSQLAHGATPAESMARALGTSGSAVVFAGLTVVVSLAGLAVVRIPLLTVMGLAGATSVGISVLVALTLVPAVALLAGDRLRPRPRRRRRSREAGAGTATARRSFSASWVRVVTRRPVLTVVSVVAVLAVMSIPAFRMILALPGASTDEPGTQSREHFDAVAESFGPGWNAPLLITADIIASDDPLGAVEDLQAEIEAVPGVVAVTTATPNESGDTALLRVIPEGGQSDPVTADLVHDLRDEAAAIEDRTGASDLRVTGTTAVNIDISEQLAAALVPFGLTVVGLSFVLLLLVFRSIAVPVKATVGYVLSVGASFGAIVAVFQWGWAPALMFGQSPGPVVSFLPIIVMGVLFGLAMDYEMFLVSRIREEYAHNGRDPQKAISSGFAHSAPVVAAAALIMVSVFGAFVPNGAAMLKPVAFGLAVGVLIDAFFVRMTLVPAVLRLLDTRAWWLPRRLDRALPTVDVEGEAVERHVQAAAVAGRSGPPVLRARQLVAHPGAEPIDLDVDSGDLAIVTVGGPRAALALASALTGRSVPVAGDVVVNGLIVPEQSEQVRCWAAVPTAADVPDGTTAEAYARRMLAMTTRSRSERRRRMTPVLAVAGPLGDPTDSMSAAERTTLSAAVAFAGGARLLLLVDPPDRLAPTLVRHGATVVLLRFALVSTTADLETVR
ncbi:MMPL family transporter [Cellulomonas endometrii]|uniref:MMPL family transporter n=1 Tax=Cellulomonas endometrii TaxID=3036301 RepID=UPI0024AC9D25|nr:MMPL family transporter [Cellulomonas endometrii]